MLNNALKTATDLLLKLIEKQKFKEEEATGDLIGNKIANKNTKVSRLPHRTVQRQFKVKQLCQKTYKYLQQIIDDLRLI